MKTIPALLACSLIAAATPVLAHHSFAMFDMASSKTVKGTVKELQWTNPHIWVQVLVAQGAAPPAEWGFEGANIAVMKRGGWTRDSLKTGDAVTVAYHPAKSGAVGGSLANITLADGRVLVMNGGLVPQTAHSIEGQN